MLLQPKRITDKCDDTGQTQGYVGLFHAIVRTSKFSTRFGQVQVERDYDSAYAACFFMLFKTIFQKNVLRAILYLNCTPA